MNLDQLRERFYNSFRRHVDEVNRAKQVVKIGLILGGALMAGVSAFIGGSGLFILSPQMTTAVQVAGVLGAIAAFAGGWFFAILDGDKSAEELEQARQAIDQAAQAALFKAELGDEIDAYDIARVRLTSLYTAYSLCRGAIEQAIANKHFGEDELISACLLASSRQLRISLGFSMHDFWTLCVYKRTVGGERKPDYLKCIAHDRSVPCDLKKARPWPEGIGVGGLALIKNDEVVVPDLSSPAIGTAFRLGESMMKPEDYERYRSLFAVPVSVGNDEKPWGVVMATSNRAYHFGSPSGFGVAPEEAVRAFAGIAALVITVCRMPESALSGRTESTEGNEARTEGKRHVRPGA